MGLARPRGNGCGASTVNRPIAGEKEGLSDATLPLRRQLPTHADDLRTVVFYPASRTPDFATNRADNRAAEHMFKFRLPCDEVGNAALFTNAPFPRYYTAEPRERVVRVIVGSP